MIKVSIVIPCYNAERFIEKTIKNCFKQNYKNLEIIVVNDGSSDKSEEVLMKLQQESSVLKVLSTKNSGAALARKHGLENATGDFIFFLDADDEIKIEAISNLVEKQQEGNYDIVIGQHEIKRNDVITLGKKYCADSNKTLQNVKNILMTEFPIFLWGQLYRKSLFESLEFHDFQVGEDLVINTQLVVLNDLKITHINESVYTYILRQDSLIQSNNPEKTKIANMAYEKSIEIITNAIDSNLIKDQLCYSALNHLYALIILNYPNTDNLLSKMEKEYKLLLSPTIAILERKKQIIIRCFTIAPFFTQRILIKMLRLIF